MTIYGTPLTFGLFKSKLLEHNLVNAELVPIKPRDIIKLRVFSVEFIRVTHSIVDGVELGIHSPVGLVVHTGYLNLILILLMVS